MTGFTGKWHLTKDKRAAGRYVSVPGGIKLQLKGSPAAVLEWDDKTARLLIEDADLALLASRQ